MFSGTIKDKKKEYICGVYMKLPRLISVILLLAFPLTALADSSSYNWLSLDRETGVFFTYIDSSEKSKLDKTLKMLNGRINDKKLDPGVASSYYNAKIFYFASCIGTDVDQDFCKAAGEIFCLYEKGNWPLRSFCQNWQKTTQMSQRIEFYKHCRVESFCVFSQHISPGALENFVSGFMPELESPILDDMSARANSLCLDLRNGDINYSNALYSYIKGLEEVTPARIAGETARAVVKTTGSFILSLIKVLGILLGIIGTAIGVLVGLKRLQAGSKE